MNKILQKLTYKLNALTSGMRQKPDFLIIGAQKAGTTSLHYYLSQHPQIFMAKAKELHYFDLNYHKPESYYLKHFLTKKKVENLRNRKSNFLQGETSPYYLYHPLVAKRAFQYNPKFKIIVLLRNPIERAFSHYQHNVKKGRETLKFEEAIRQESSRIAGEKSKIMQNAAYISHNHRHFSYIDRGKYAEQLKVWEEVFPLSQILVLSTRALKTEPTQSLNRIFHFLKVENYKVSLVDKKNKGSYAKTLQDSVSSESLRWLENLFTESNLEISRKYQIVFNESNS